VNKNFSADLKLPAVKGGATVWFDSRLVPHIHATNDHDLYFLEGYVHATFRLWQMDMETRAAAGRVSEVVGDKALAFDRKQRYKGMGYAAENSLRAMEADPRTKLIMDAYTEGINAYIATLNYRNYPFEYKLMGFAPEPYTNLKISLLLKYMADDLTGSTDDIALTYLRDVLPKEELDLLFPDRIPGSTPVIPASTVFDKPSLTIPTAPPDSIAFPHFSPADFGEPKVDGKGSNNWILNGSRTASGAPILCNDPHLALNLPSLWYEAQLQAPGINVYGASLPGTPGIVIGFNDSLTWGFTNNYRDVKDFYLIKEVEGNKNKYWFAGNQVDYAKRVEVIKVKGKPDVVDTINYTLHGPVTYAEQNAKAGGLRKPLAMCWMGHRPSNEMLAIYLLNKARSYNEFVDAIMHFECPAQNMGYADRQGNIAMWGQGQFVNKWKDQGKYVMNGTDSSTLWKELIPMRENPHALNPAQGYLCGANQINTDSTYPYNYNGSGWVNLRAWRINDLLKDRRKATVKDMMDMQQDTYSELAAGALPLMLKTLPDAVNEEETEFTKLLKNWDYQLGAESKAATFFQIWWNLFSKHSWQRMTERSEPGKILLGRVPDDFWPLQERTVQLLQMNIGAVEKVMTPEQNIVWGLRKFAKESFQFAIDSMHRLEKKGNEWYKVKNTTVAHLTKLPALSYDHIKIGGWGNTINAAKNDHGPSWRMVVQMGKEIEAYGVYPGGQSGNPGSKYYASFLDDWAGGKYYRLDFMPNADKQVDSSIKYTWTFQP
jgi:penicillin amidase